MLYREIFKILGSFFLGLAILLCVPLLFACYEQLFVSPSEHPQPYSAAAFFYSLLCCIAISSMFFFFGRNSRFSLYRREGLAAVVFIWFLTPVVGALPYFFSGTFDQFSQCYFEAASGFTTTGLSMMEPKKYDPFTGEEVPIRRTFCGLQDISYEFMGTITPVRNPETGQIILEGIDAVSPPILFWRSFTQWIGGIGIVVLFVALLPLFGVGGKFLVQSEFPGPMKDSLTPRIKETAWILLKIYVILSFVEVLVLVWINPEITWLEAVTLAFSTISTGGFTIHNQSIAYYQDEMMEWVLLVFMILGSINFSLYFYSLKGKFYRWYDGELILFLLFLFIFSFFVVSDIVGTKKFSPDGESNNFLSIGEAVRYGVFQLVSAQTSTGFTTYNYSTWPALTQAFMLIVMFIGGMSSSTAGGMKVMRQSMLFRIAQNKVEWMFRPEAVRTFRMGDTPVTVSTSITVLCFFLIVIATAVLGTLLYMMDGIDSQTALGLVGCNMNNIGISFAAAGPEFSAAFLPPFSTLLSSVLMMMGRLEYFAVLVVLVPAFWQENI